MANAFFPTPPEGPQGPPGPSAVDVASVAALSTTPDTTLVDGSLAFITAAKFRALWRLDRSSSLTAEGVTAVASQSGAKWVLNSRYSSAVNVTECGLDPSGAADCSAAFQALLNALSVTNVCGAAVYFPAGTYKFLTAVNIPSNTLIIGSLGAVIQSAVTTSGQNTWGNQGAVGAQVTLSADVAAGATTITTATSIAQGQTIILTDTGIQKAFLYFVQSVTGTGPYTVTLDRATVTAMPKSTSTVYLVTSPQNIRVIGNGMRFTGTNTLGAYLAFSLGYRISVSDVIADDSGGHLNQTGGIAFMFDTGCLDCEFVDCRSFSSAPQGFRFSGVERGLLQHCQATNTSSGGAGILLSDAYACDVIACQAFGNTGDGLFMTGDIQPTGCQDIRVIGGAYFSNGQNGVHLNDGCARIQCVGVESLRNGVNGFWVDPTGAVVTNVLLSGCVATGNGTNGILQGNAAGCIGLSVIGCDVSNNVQTGLYLSDSAVVANLTAIGGNSTHGIFVIGGTVSLENIRLQSAAVNWHAIDITNGTPDVRMSRLHITMDDPSGNPIGVNIGVGKVWCEYIKVDGANVAANGLGLQLYGGVTDFGRGVEVDACTLPLWPFPLPATLLQSGRTPIATTGGTTTLTVAQASGSVLEVTGTLTQNAIIAVPNIPGLEYVVVNKTTGSFTLTVQAAGGTGFAVAQNKSASGYVNGSTAFARTGPDT